MRKKTIIHILFGLAVGVGLALIVGAVILPAESMVTFDGGIKTQLMVYSDYAKVQAPTWGEGESWKPDKAVKIVGITMRVSIMPLRNPSDNTSYLTSGFSHGCGEVSLSDKPHDEQGALLQGQVYFNVADGLGAVAGTSNANVAIMYPAGSGVILGKGQPLYIRMFHEVYSSNPGETICDAVAIISYVEAE